MYELVSINVLFVVNEIVVLNPDVEISAIDHEKEVQDFYVTITKAVDESIEEQVVNLKDNLNDLVEIPIFG